MDSDNKYEFNLKKTNKPKINSKSSTTNNLQKNSNTKLKDNENDDKIMNDFKKFSLEPNLENDFDEEFERKLKEKSKRTREVFENNEPDTKKVINNSNQSQLLKKIIPNEKVTSNGSLNKTNNPASNFDAANNLDYTIKPIDIETAKVGFVKLFFNFFPFLDKLIIVIYIFFRKYAHCCLVI